MSPSQIVKTLASLLLGLLVTASAVTAAPVTFQVRMSQQITLGNFDPDSDFVDLAGSFNDWGTSPLTPLSDADGDSIYEVTVGGFTPSETIEYKFRYNGQWGGTEEFPGVGNNRVYTVQGSGDSILVWYDDLAPPSGGGELHWWNDTVFYEILVRSFQDSDGDGIGDFQGLIQRLDHLNDGDPATDDDLGVTGIWLMPINDSPSYHGYDAVDYRSINPDYGTMADFQEFLDEAHARGIKVIIDYVMNHCSDQHPWFVSSSQGDPTYRDWFRWEPQDPGQGGPWGQQVWHWDPSGWYYGLFWSGMPDLNYDTPAVRAEMFDTATFWLDTVGVDGFRLDAVLYIDEEGSQLQTTPGTLQFWQDYNTHVKSVKPEMLSVGEAWTGTSTVVQYVSEDRLDLCFEFDLSYAMVGAANGADAAYLSTKAAQVSVLYPYLQFATFLTNHDQDRVFTVLGEDAGKARVAAGILLTLPGVPFLYYGEEIGMTGSGDHRFIRSPMQWTGAPGAGFTTGTPWQPINSNHTQYNVADMDQDPGSLLEWYRDLVHLRNRTPALRRGLHDAMSSSESAVLAFVRSHEQQTLLCLANTSAFPRFGVTVSGAVNTLEPGDHRLVNLLDPADVREVTISQDREITGLDIGGHEVAVFEVDSVTAVDPGGETGPAVRLLGARPNPFNTSTAIRYSLPVEGHVRLTVHDLRGRMVAVIRDGVEPAGEREAAWTGTDRAGRPLGAGLYFVRLRAGAATRVSKVLLVR